MGEDKLSKTEDQKQHDAAVYNPIIGLDKDDEGVDKNEWIKKQNLKSQGFCSTFTFFCKQSCKDIRRHKCQFCLGFCSVFVVVLITLIINTLIDKGPIIFLRLAEGSIGQVDAYIESEDNLNRFGISNREGGTKEFTNLTQILSLYGNKYNLSPRKWQDVVYSLPLQQPSQGSISSTTGLPVYTSSEIDSFVWNENKKKTLIHIDSDREDELGCGRTYKFGKLELGQCVINKDMADLEDLKVGDIVQFEFNIYIELYILWNHYKAIEGDTTGYVPQMGDIVAPCKVAGIFSDTGGKLPSSDDSSTIIMEVEYFYQWLSPYVQPGDTHPSMDAFRSFLLRDSVSTSQLANYVIMNFPDPRIDYYKESNYDDIQNNVVDYANELVNDLGFFKESVQCRILEELQDLSLGLVFLGILFSIVSFLFIIISVLLIYSLLMVTVEEKSFEIGIYRMVGLNKVGLVTMVLLKAFFFVMPAIIAAFIICIPILWIVFRMFLDESMGTTLLPFPTGLAIFYALCIGIVIPLLSSLAPLNVVLSKNLTEALDYSHSKTKAAYVKIMRAQDFDRKPYIIFGLIAVGYGLSIYYFLPLALISLNFGLLLSIFFLILIGMFIGMVLLALNIQRILEIIMVYVFLFYETTSMRILVLKNLIAHKPRNRMTVAIYAMSIGFLIMIVVAYNLEIYNSLVEQKMEEGSYLHMLATGDSTLKASQIEPYLREVDHLIKYHSWETFETRQSALQLNTNDAFLSDELTLLNFPMNIYGVTPFYIDSLITEYMSISSQNESTGLGLSEQLYTARGSQSGAMGGNIMRKLNVKTNDWTTTYKLNLFTDNWNVFLRQRGLWSAKYVPGKTMLDRDAEEGEADTLISVPTFKKLIADYTSINDYGFNKIIIRLKNTGSSSDLSTVKKKLAESAEDLSVSIYDSTENDGSFDSALYILNIIFSIVIAFVMFLCFFSLSSSITANMLEQRKEIGVLRVIGFKKSRIYFLYIYECFILIFSGCMIGVMIGTLIGWTIMLQRALFSNIPLTFFFPWIQVLTMFLISVVCAFIVTVFPARNILNHQISEIFRSG